MPGALRHLSYPFDGLSEQLLVVDPHAPNGPHSPRVLIVPPLFDEMNRMRRTLVLAMHNLAQRGIGSALMDLPGANESLAPLETQSLASWRAAVGAAARSFAIDAAHADAANAVALNSIPANSTAPLVIASVRGGCLIDDGADAAYRWRLSPAKGSRLLKTLLRTRIAGERVDGRTVTAAQLMALAQAGPIELAGNRIGPDMAAQLDGALPAPLPATEPARAVQLGSGADCIAGSALWLRAEPGEDAAMAAGIAQDIAQLLA